MKSLERETHNFSSVGKIKLRKFIPKKKLWQIIELLPSAFMRKAFTRFVHVGITVLIFCQCELFRNEKDLNQVSCSFESSYKCPKILDIHAIDDPSHPHNANLEMKLITGFVYDPSVTLFENNDFYKISEFRAQINDSEPTVLTSNIILTDPSTIGQTLVFSTGAWRKGINTLKIYIRNNSGYFAEEQFWIENQYYENDCLHSDFSNDFPISPTGRDASLKTPFFLHADSVNVPPGASGSALALFVRSADYTQAVDFTLGDKYYYYLKIVNESNTITYTIQGPLTNIFSTYNFRKSGDSAILNFTLLPNPPVPLDRPMRIDISTGNCSARFLITMKRGGGDGEPPPLNCSEAIPPSAGTIMLEDLDGNELVSPLQHGTQFVARAINFVDNTTRGLAYYWDKDYEADKAYPSLTDYGTSIALTAGSPGNTYGIYVVAIDACGRRTSTYILYDVN